MKKVLILTLLIGIILIPGSSILAANNQTIPTMSIVTVVKDLEVTVQTYNFPAEKTFNVYMGKIGTRAIGGHFVGTFESGEGGEVMVTFAIPEELWVEEQISIRLEASPSGYFSYDWFYNSDGNAPLSDYGAIIYPYGIPATTISEVVPGETVTVEGSNFPTNDDLTVTIGKWGTKGVGGEVVASHSAGNGGEFTATYDIPESLKGETKLAIRFQSYITGHYAYDWFNNAEGSVINDEIVVYPASYPYSDVVEVDPGNTVTLLLYSFPANDSLTVTIGYFGTRGVGGIEVEPIPDTGDLGEFSATFTIPDALKDEPKLSIRLVSDSTGWYAYDWFNNVEGLEPYGPNPNAPVVVVSTPWPDDPDLTDDVVYPDGAPWLKILEITPGESVKVQVGNFPTNDAVVVTMGDYGTSGIGSFIVNYGYGTGELGAFTTTFGIPAGLQDKEKISIRLESTETGYYAYKVFTNVEAIVPITTPDPDDGDIVFPEEDPYIEVISVIAGESIVLKVRNFPTNDAVVVTMGDYWTKGIGGFVVNHGYGTGVYGEFTATFGIPAGLQDTDMIAIRLESAETGYFAFDIFTNE